MTKKHPCCSDERESLVLRLDLIFLCFIAFLSWLIVSHIKARREQAVPVLSAISAEKLQSMLMEADQAKINMPWYPRPEPSYKFLASRK